MSPERRSLNYREINLLLTETDLVGARVREIFQPRPEELIIVFFHQGRSRPLLFCMSQKACRFHFLSAPFEKGVVRQRFVSYLTAHIRDAVVTSIEHVADQRILKLAFERGGRRVFLWARLWSSAPNIVFTDEDGTIGDVLFRRPKKGEVSGGRYNPEDDYRRAPPVVPDPNQYPVRDFGGAPGLSLHERVEAYFKEAETASIENELRARLLNKLAAEEERLASSLSALERLSAEHDHAERFREFGDLIMAAMGEIKQGDKWLHARDFFNNDEPVDISLNPALTPALNAEAYYRRYKKMKAAREKREEERKKLRRKLDEVRTRLAEAEAAPAPLLEALASKIFAPAAKTAVKEVPGLRFSSGGFIIYVGRSGRENEELYRRHVRGNDYWLHVRDFPGASVFIKSQKGKSIPLEVLLDAGNLALFYSRGKNAEHADLYYTQVKYLRKAAATKPGLFLPTHEKNLFLRFEPERIARLKETSESFN